MRVVLLSVICVSHSSAPPGVAARLITVQRERRESKRERARERGGGGDTQREREREREMHRER